jgi:hypothetical protein
VEPAGELVTARSDDASLFKSVRARASIDEPVARLALRYAAI